MQEVKNARTLTSKTFLIKSEGNTKTLQKKSGTKAIHYFDKLDSKRFRGIDHKLIWDDVKKGWGFKYNSYQPFFPEYADGCICFRDLYDKKDQTTTFTALASHIKGVLIDTDDTNPNFDSNIDNKAVLYADAFGVDRDMILYNTRTNMIKVATVNNPNDQVADAIFEWEVELSDITEVSRDVLNIVDGEPQTSTVTHPIKTFRGSPESLAYELDTTLDKEFDTAKMTLTGAEIDGEETFTYFGNYKAWDSEGNTITVIAKLYHLNGKYILRKTIPVAFMQSAVGRVFTDTLITFYPNAIDGFIQDYNTTSVWATSRGYATGSSISTTSSSNLFNYLRHNVAGSNWGTMRNFFPFDTTLPADANITATDLSFYCISIASSVSANIDTTVGIIAPTTQATDTGLTTADYDQCGSLNSPQEIATRPTIYSWTTSAHNAIPLNSTGLSIINKSGYTLIGVRNEYDIDNVEMASGKYSRYVDIHFSDETGLDKDPFLLITYTAELTEDNVTGWWDMDEGSGAVLNDKKEVSPTNGTITGAAWTTGGPTNLDDGLAFSVNTHKAVMAKKYQMSRGSLVTWYKGQNSGDSFQSIANNAQAFQGVGQASILIEKTATKLWAYTSFDVTNATAIWANHLHNTLYMAVQTWTDDGTPTVKLYVDSVLQATQTGAGLVKTTTQDFVLGDGSNEVGGFNLTGDIYQTILFDKVLEQSDIDDLYNSGDGVTYEQFFGGAVNGLLVFPPF